VPKTCMHLIVNQVKEFLSAEMLAQLYSNVDQGSLMEESAEEAQRRDDTLRMYHAMKEALDIIGEVSMTTVSTPTPPPVKNDWLAVESSGEHSQNPAPSPTAIRRPMHPPPAPSAGNGRFVPSLPPPGRPAPAPPGRQVGGRPSVGLPPPLMPQRPGANQATGNVPRIPDRPAR